ncbi:MAG: hypothetical protein ACOVOV_07185 [Dolichospermum sp.]|jgi:hypothetical protein
MLSPEKWRQSIARRVRWLQMSNVALLRRMWLLLRCAQYLGCAETVPLSQRLAALEAKVEELQALVKKY